ncbi:MAG: hypothetical protein ABW032_05250 [Burkholderiaceae bacterium]
MKNAAAAAAILFGAAAAHAAPLTYEFTGVMMSGFGFDGQAVAGALTVDPSLYSGFAGDGSTWAQGYGENSAGPAPRQPICRSARPCASTPARRSTSVISASSMARGRSRSAISS